MDYEKSYKEALERARLAKSCNSAKTCKSE